MKHTHGLAHGRCAYLSLSAGLIGALGVGFHNHGREEVLECTVPLRPHKDTNNSTVVESTSNAMAVRILFHRSKGIHECTVPRQHKVTRALVPRACLLLVHAGLLHTHISLLLQGSKHGGSKEHHKLLWLRALIIRHGQSQDDSSAAHIPGRA